MALRYTFDRTAFLAAASAVDQRATYNTIAKCQALGATVTDDAAGGRVLVAFSGRGGAVAFDARLPVSPTAVEDV